MTMLSRSNVEDFLYHEAALLDAWQLEEWFALFADEANYSIPAPDDPDGEPETSLFVIADDRPRLRDRVTQLLGEQSWAERPRSRTRRTVANVMIAQQSETDIEIWSNLIIHRTRMDKISVFFGRARHLLTKHGGEIRISDRRIILDLESLQSVGKISFIL